MGRAAAQGGLVAEVRRVGRRARGGDAEGGAGIDRVEARVADADGGGDAALRDGALLRRAIVAERLLAGAAWVRGAEEGEGTLAAGAGLGG